MLAVMTMDKQRLGQCLGGFAQPQAGVAFYHCFAAAFTVMDLLKAGIPKGTPI
jgi:hypothetical protein